MIIIISRDISKGFYPPEIKKKKWIEYSGGLFSLGFFPRDPESPKLVVVAGVSVSVTLVYVFD